MFSTHHDVGRDDAGVVTHGLDKKDLRTDKQHCSNLLLCGWGESLRIPLVAVTTLRHLP